MLGTQPGIGQSAHEHGIQLGTPGMSRTTARSTGGQQTIVPSGAISHFGGLSAVSIAAANTISKSFFIFPLSEIIPATALTLPLPPPNELWRIAVAGSWLHADLHAVLIGEVRQRADECARIVQVCHLVGRQHARRLIERVLNGRHTLRGRCISVPDNCNLIRVHDPPFYETFVQQSSIPTSVVVFFHVPLSPCADPVHVSL